MELSVTAEVKHPRKGSFWVKVGSGSTVRPGETPRQASDRVSAYVVGTLDERIQEVLS